MKSFVLFGFVLAATVMPAPAVDGGFGRSIPGTWVLPSTGVVGQGPGYSVTTLPIGYMGAIGGNRVDPVAGVIVFNDQADTSINVLIPRYVYKTELKKVRFASMVFVPFNWWTVRGAVLNNGVFQCQQSANASVGDVIVAPLTVGIRFSENNNLALSGWIWAPTGLWRAGNISNVGMGVWTFMPNAGHTYYWEKYKLEFDNFVGFDMYFRNPATNYTSGTMFHWDGMAIRYFGNKKAGVGAIGSNLTRLLTTQDRWPIN
jgi:hypothetical protein